MMDDEVVLLESVNCDEDDNDDNHWVTSIIGNMTTTPASFVTLTLIIFSIAGKNFDKAFIYRSKYKSSPQHGVNKGSLALKEQQNNLRLPFM